MAKRVLIVEIETCGDVYCGGHGEGQRVEGVRNDDGTLTVLGKNYKHADEVFQTGIRDLVEVREIGDA